MTNPFDPKPDDNGSYGGFGSNPGNNPGSNANNPSGNNGGLPRYEPTTHPEDQAASASPAVTAITVASPTALSPMVAAPMAPTTPVSRDTPVQATEVIPGMRALVRVQALPTRAQSAP